MSFEEILALPRLSGLRLSPEGRRALVAVSSVDDGARHFGSRLAEIDLDTGTEASPPAVGDLAITEAAYLSDGRLVVAASQAGAAIDTATSGLWAFDQAGGTPEQLLPWPLPIRQLRVARDAAAVSFVSDAYPTTSSAAADLELHRLRNEAEITSMLFEEYPVRFWDHYVGPRVPHLFHANLGSTAVNLTSDVGPHLAAMGSDIAPDGSLVVAAVRRRGAATQLSDLYSFAPGQPPTRLNHDDAWYDLPKVSPDGTQIVAIRREVGGPTRASDCGPWLFDVATGEGHLLIPDFPSWPTEISWAANSGGVYFVAPDRGWDAIFALEVDQPAAELVLSGSSFSDLCSARDGSIVALRSSFRQPPHVVEFASATGARQLWPAAQAARATPAAAHPERITREQATASDGVAVPYWLLLPESASAVRPTPLIVLCNAYLPGAWTDRWYFRWNPTAYTAAGYAVIMPDVSPSLGNGRDYIERGWGRWAEVAAPDLLAAVDDVARLPAVDASRAALVGGGWGGWLAAWVAGHSERFRAIVTQGAAWNLESYQATTDEADRWEEQLGPRFGVGTGYNERYRLLSPSAAAEAMTTPALIVTGDRDYRAPSDDALAMFRELRARGTDAKLLLMPGEGHRIGTLASETVWYQTIFAFLDHHLRDVAWLRPPLL